MQLTLEDARELIHNVKGNRLATNNNIIVVENSKWISYGKHDERYCIFLDESTRRYYRLYASRSGSHWQGYEHEYDTTAKEVFRKEVITYEWVTAKHQASESCT